MSTPKSIFLLLILSFLAPIAVYAQSPYTVYLSTYDPSHIFTSTINFEYHIYYLVPVGRLIQVIKPGTNGVLDPPNHTTNNGELGGDDILNSSFAVGDSAGVPGVFDGVKLTGYSYFNQFAYFSNNEHPGGNTVWFITGDTLRGPVHTNDYFSMMGYPRFYSSISSAHTYSSTQPYNTSGATNPYFAVPPVWNSAPIPFPTNVDAQRIAATSSGAMFTNSTLYVQFNVDGTYSTKTTSGGTWTSHTRPGNGIIFVGPPTGTSTAYTVYVQGVVSGQYSLVCQGTINITGDITYNTDPRINPNSTDLLGLVAQKDVVLINNNASDRTIMAHIITMDTASTITANFYNSQYNSITSGTLHLYGGLAVNSRGAIGTSGTPRYGYLKDYRYDSRLSNTPPPGYTSTSIDSTALNNGQMYYLRCWANVPTSNSLPFPLKSHYQDIGPFTMNLGNVWNISFSPYTWSLCGGLEFTDFNYGHNIYAGSVDTIRWNAPDITGNVTIELNTTYPSANWTTLGTAPASQNWYLWTPTSDQQSNRARIRITSIDNPAVSDTNFTTFIIGGVLPVQLSSFSATVNQTGINLNWHTESERNNDHFMLERMNRTEAYQTITEVPSAAPNGNSAIPHNYQYVDHRVVTGTTYTYRLSQVDLDGTPHILRTVTVTNKVNAAVANNFGLLSVYPNPFNATTTFRVQLPQAGLAKLTVYNLNGELIRAVFDGKLDRQVHTFSFDGSDLSSGQYLVKMQVGNSTATQQISLVK